MRLSRVFASGNTAAAALEGTVFHWATHVFCLRGSPRGFVRGGVEERISPAEGKSLGTEQPQRQRPRKRRSAWEAPGPPVSRQA